MFSSRTRSVEATKQYYNTSKYSLNNYTLLIDFMTFWCGRYSVVQLLLLILKFDNNFSIEFGMYTELCSFVFWLEHKIIPTPVTTRVL